MFRLCPVDFSYSVLLCSVGISCYVLEELTHGLHVGRRCCIVVQILSDVRLNSMLKRIGEVIHDDTRYLKGALGIRTQKCFAVKVVKLSDCLNLRVCLYNQFCATF